MMSQKKLRIIHCFRSPVGGIFRHVRDLVHAHTEQGHQVGILCDSSTGGAHEDRLFEDIIPKLELGLRRIPIRRAITPGDVLAARKVYKEIKSLQPDVLHGHGAKGGAYVRLIGSFLRGSRSRVTRIYSPHGGTLHYPVKSFKSRIYFGVERFLERWTEGMVFVSDYERRTYDRKIGAPSTPTHLIYNGLQDKDFEPIQMEDAPVDFLYIGMMRDLKGPDVFIDAMRLAEQAVQRPLHGLMVGDGPDKDKYQLMLERKGLSNRIKMLDAMPARDAFAKAQRIVIPSRAEAMPYIVLETLAANKPILATDVGGIPEILGTDSALMAEPGNSAALAKLMARSLEDDTWLAKNLPNRDEFIDKFSVNTMAKRMMDVYLGQTT